MSIIMPSFTLTGPYLVGFLLSPLPSVILCVCATYCVTRLHYSTYNGFFDRKNFHGSIMMTNIRILKKKGENAYFMNMSDNFIWNMLSL